MLAAFSEIAEIERETIVSRVRSGLEAAKKKELNLVARKNMTKLIGKKSWNYEKKVITSDK